VLFLELFEDPQQLERLSLAEIDQAVDFTFALSDYIRKCCVVHSQVEFTVHTVYDHWQSEPARKINLDFLSDFWPN
jgi:hypothetical protein